MAVNTQNSRHRIKRSILTGVTPTVPTSTDFTDGTWLNTDIRAGEFFFNSTDERLWIGGTASAIELTLVGSTASSLFIKTNNNIEAVGSTASLLIGSTNVNSGDRSISVGFSNTNSGTNSILTGFGNTNESNLAIISGGSNIIGPTSTAPAIIGGETNTINSFSDYAVIIGGGSNVLSGYAAGIFVGRNNNVSAHNSAIIGGTGNSIPFGATNSVILGGTGITASASNTVYTPDLLIQAGKSIGSIRNTTGINTAIALDALGTTGSIEITSNIGATLSTLVGVYKDQASLGVYDGGRGGTFSGVIVDKGLFSNDINMLADSITVGNINTSNLDLAATDIALTGDSITLTPTYSLDVSTTGGGLIVPRLTTAQRNAMTGINGMLIYNTTTAKFQGYEAGAWVNLI